MEEESGQTLTDDFELVLKELPAAAQPATQTQSASYLGCGTARARPGITITIMEEGLAGVVTKELSRTEYTSTSRL